MPHLATYSANYFIFLLRCSPRVPCRAKAQPAGGRLGWLLTAYRLAVVQPILAERYSRAFVVGVAVVADCANRDGLNDKRVGRVLLRAQGSVAGEGIGQAVVSADCHRGLGLA
jgi:hypothetical protein